MDQSETRVSYEEVPLPGKPLLAVWPRLKGRRTRTERQLNLKLKSCKVVDDYSSDLPILIGSVVGAATVIIVASAVYCMFADKERRSRSRRMFRGAVKMISYDKNPDYGRSQYGGEDYVATGVKDSNQLYGEEYYDRD